MVLTLEFLGIRSIGACVGAAESTEGFTRWYTKLLRTVVHIDVSSEDFSLFSPCDENDLSISEESLCRCS